MTHRIGYLQDHILKGLLSQMFRLFLGQVPGDEKNGNGHRKGYGIKQVVPFCKDCERSVGDEYEKQAAGQPVDNGQDDDA